MSPVPDMLDSTDTLSTGSCPKYVYLMKSTTGKLIAVRIRVVMPFGNKVFPNFQNKAIFVLKLTVDHCASKMKFSN